MGRIRPNERIPHRPTACGATNGSIGQRDSPDGGVSGWSIAEKSYAIAGLIRINFRVRPFIVPAQGWWDYYSEAATIPRHCSR